MKEIQDILRAYEENRGRGSESALATVVKVRGSTYRRPGARMLMSDDGRCVGSLSGGCLEADVLEKAKPLMGGESAVAAVYDMTSEDEVWGLNQGCNGVVQVLVEPLPLTKELPYIRFLRECIECRRRGVVATVFRVDGEFKAKVGARIILREDGSIIEDVRHPTLTAALVEDSLQVLDRGRSKVREYRFTEGTVEAFIEAIHPPVPLVLFSAGSDTIPLARLAAHLGWHITVVDHRPSLLTRDRFPDAHALLLARPEEVREKVPLDALSMTVIMTHNFTHDLLLLKALLPSRVPYIGLLGPKKRTTLLLEKLRAEGVVTTGDQLARLHNPVGLDIGAETPEEIALSILSEIRAFLSRRAGGFLKDHPGPIHDPH